VVQWLRPQVLLPSAAGGDVTFSGLLVSLLRAEGSPADLRRTLAEQQLDTKVLTVRPGERLDLQPVLTNR
jgi:hypothetical protein